MLRPFCEISHPLCPLLQGLQLKQDFNLHNLPQFRGEGKEVRTGVGRDPWRGGRCSEDQNKSGERYLEGKVGDRGRRDWGMA